MDKMEHVSQFKKFKDYIDVYQSGLETYINKVTGELNNLYTIIAEQDKKLQLLSLSKDGIDFYPDKVSEMTIRVTEEPHRVSAILKTKWGTSTIVFESKMDLLLVPCNETILYICLVEKDSIRSLM